MNAEPRTCHGRSGHFVCGGVELTLGVNCTKDGMERRACRECVKAAAHAYNTSPERRVAHAAGARVWRRTPVGADSTRATNTRARARVKADPALSAARRKAQNEWARKAYAANPDVWRAQGAKSMRKLRSTEAGRAKSRAALKRWQKTPAGRATCKALGAQRRAAKLLRSPSWSRTAEHRARVRELYEDAALFSQYFIGGPFVVDHCIALQGATVSGLHLESNLRICPALLNNQKHNRSLDVRPDAPDAWRDPPPVFARVAVRRLRIERGVWSSDDHCTG